LKLTKLGETGAKTESVYYLMVNLDADLTFREATYYAVLFVLFLNNCANPFIYATKFEHRSCPLPNNAENTDYWHVWA